MINHINDNLHELLIKSLEKYQENDITPIATFGKIQSGYAFKSKELIEFKTKNRVIKIKNLNNSIIGDINNTQFIEDNVAKNIDIKFKIKVGDVAVAMTGAELGKTGIILGSDNYYLNQRVGLIKGNNVENEIYLKVIFLSNKFQELLNSKGYGSAQPNISSKDIENIEINNITKDNIRTFSKLAIPIYENIINNAKENIILEQLRDTLLPKLMNGEIDLDKIEI